MDYKKTFIEGDNRYIKYINYMNQLSKTEHKNLAKIHLTCLKQCILFKLFFRNSYVYKG